MRGLAKLLVSRQRVGGEGVGVVLVVERVLGDGAPLLFNPFQFPRILFARFLAEAGEGLRLVPMPNE